MNQGFTEPTSGPVMVLVARASIDSDPQSLRDDIAQTLRDDGAARGGGMAPGLP
jgi:hypothetical protein